MKKTNDQSAFYLVVNISFLLLLTRIAPGLYWGESSLLTARSWFLGGSHPPGYSFFLQFNHFMLKCIPFGDIPFRSNLTSCLILVLAAAMFFLLLRAIKVPTVVAVPEALTLPLATALVQACAVAEVYSLNLLFVLSVLLLIVKASYRKLLLVSFVSGLAVTHHLTFVLVLPAVILVSAYWLLKQKIPVRKWSMLIIFFLLGCSSLIFLPVRESVTPLQVWGESSNLEGFVSLVTASEESTGSFLSGLKDSVALKSRFSNLQLLVVDTLTLPGLVLVIPGLLFLYRRSRSLSIILVSYLLFLTAMVTVYHSNESASFYVPGLASLWFLSVAGLACLIKQSKTSRYRPVRSLQYLLLILPSVMLFLAAFNPTGRFPGKAELTSRLSAHRVNSVIEDALLISRRSDYCFVNWYQQSIEKRFSGYTVFQHLLSFKWYYEDLQRQGLMDDSLDEYNFEDTRNWNSVVTAFLVRKNLPQRSLYLIESEILADIESVGFKRDIMSCSDLGLSLSPALEIKPPYELKINLEAFTDPVSTQAIASDYSTRVGNFNLCRDKENTTRYNLKLMQLHEIGKFKGWW